jgi:hypothetical protein
MKTIYKIVIIYAHYFSGARYDKGIHIELWVTLTVTNIVEA